jgi:DNA-binding FadR family transcriptional regulator
MEPSIILPYERQLVEQLGMSRSPVREALTMLKTLGIVEIRQGRQSCVRQMDTGMLQRLFRLVFRLEGQDTFLQIDAILILSAAWPYSGHRALLIWYGDLLGR